LTIDVNDSYDDVYLIQ